MFHVLSIRNDNGNNTWTAVVTRLDIVMTQLAQNTACMFEQPIFDHATIVETVIIIDGLLLLTTAVKIAVTPYMEAQRRPVFGSN